MIAKKSRIVILVVVCGVMVMGLGYVLFESMILQSTPRARVAHWLNVAVPRAVAELRYYYYQSPGSYQARLFIRMKLSKENFSILMNSIGATRDEGGDSQKLATDFNTDRSISWWNPPHIQDERFLVKKSDGTITTCLWDAGYAYIEKIGPFGSVFNRQPLLQN